MGKSTIDPDAFATKTFFVTLAGVFLYTAAVYFFVLSDDAPTGTESSVAAGKAAAGDHD